MIAINNRKSISSFLSLIDYHIANQTYGIYNTMVSYIHMYYTLRASYILINF